MHTKEQYHPKITLVERTCTPRITQQQVQVQRQLKTIIVSLYSDFESSFQQECTTYGFLVSAVYMFTTAAQTFSQWLRVGNLFSLERGQVKCSHKRDETSYYVKTTHSIQNEYRGSKSGLA